MNALIFGIGGQDGSFMAELLLSKGYEVFGTTRRSSIDNLSRLKNLSDYTIIEADLADAQSVQRTIEVTEPDEIYNLADQDLVSSSFMTPRYSVDVTAGGPANIFEAVATCCSRSKGIKVFQPCSSTIFGSGHNHFCTEDTPLNPESPYACAKAHALLLAKMYRKKYGMFISTATLYGHNSDRQKCDYLLHKFARDAVRISRDPSMDKINVRDPDFQVDIGHAKEFVYGMYQLMQLSSPQDIILSTGKPVRVGDLASLALYEAGVEKDMVEKFVVEKEVNASMSSAIPSRAYDLFAWKAKANATDVVTELVEHYRKVLKCA